MPIQPIKIKPIYGILLIAFALQLHHLARDSFWGDEILTAFIAHQSPREIITLTASDIHPPLYYLFIKVWSLLIISQPQPNLTSDWLWRFPSVMVSLFTIALTYLLTPYLLPKKQATAVAMLLATAPIVIKYSQEARMHALFMGLSLLATWLLMQALRRPRWPYWVAFACTTAANLYTVYFGFLILASHMAFVALLPSSKKNAKRHFLMAVIGAGILYTPWAFILADIIRHRAQVGAIEGGVGSPVTFLTGLVQALGPLPMPIAWGFLGLYWLGLFTLIRQRAWPQAALIACWVGLPTLLPLILGDPRALQFRYAFVMPIYLIGVVQGLSTLNNLLREYTPLQTLEVLKTSDVSRLLYQYMLWLLVTVSFIATIGIYNQTKPNWRAAASYLDEHARPDDLILFGPLWDEGRFISYYYHGQAQLLTPAALVTNIEHYAEIMRQTNGRIWAVNNFTPQASPLAETHEFDGVVLSEPKLNVYEPPILTQIALDLAHQAVDGAYPWAEAARAQGVINPDPRTAQAAALKAWGDTLLAAHQLPAAIAAYQQAVTQFPGWVSGYTQLAEAQELAGNLSAAAQAYQQAVAFNAKWQGTQADEAAALMAQGRWAEALEQYHQLIEGK